MYSQPGDSLREGQACSIGSWTTKIRLGLRGIVELVEALRMQGGGVGVFTGCAADDTGAALVLRVE